MIRLAIRVRRADAEIVLAELLTVAPSGVEEVDVSADVVEYAVYGSPGEVPSLPDVRAAVGGALVEVSSTEVADDWDQRWRSFHRPLVLPGELRVRPPWEPAGPEPIDVVIDPGQAFGTGAHATTRLCLEWLLSMASSGSARGPLLDLGCGSGVLAIVACRLGFGPVTAVDYDVLSLDATAANASANGVSVSVARHDLRVDPLLVAPTVTANLLGPLLRQWAGRLAASEGGLPSRVVASGLLVGEMESVVEAFGAAGLVEAGRKTLGEWAALLLERAGG